MTKAVDVKSLENVLSHCTSEQAEVVGYSQSSALTRFSNSVIHQNMAESNQSVWVRAVTDKRIGSAVANQVDRKTAASLARKADSNARHAPPDEAFDSLPVSPPMEDEGNYVEATAACTPAKRAEIAALIVEESGKSGLIAAGSVATSSLNLTVANSLGTRSRTKQSEVAVTILLMGKDSSGYSQFSSSDIDKLDARSLAKRAVGKATASANPQELGPGAYEVILEPLAVADMIGFLAYIGLGAQSVQENRSFMCGKMGQRLVSELVTIVDDSHFPGLPALPFDFEGVAKQRVPLIEEGVAAGVVYDSYTAAKEKRSSTGHALPPASGLGPLPTSLVMMNGTTPAAKMVAGAKRAIQVTRFHYTNIEDPLATLYTGMTRDGTFLVEEGRVSCGIKNMRFTQSIVEALANVTEVSQETEFVDSIMGTCSVPWLKISGFNFTGSTTF